jgi:hypothetical protein
LSESLAATGIAAAPGHKFHARMIQHCDEMRSVEIFDALSQGVRRYLVCTADETESDDATPIG